MFLNPSQLLQGYMNGYFPMADSETGQIHWYSPNPRAIIPLDTDLQISKRLLKEYTKTPFTFTINQDFNTVIESCAIRRQDDTWLSEPLMESYKKLHTLGYAHSFEAYLNGKLVGGLYGLSIGKAFFGESMFYTVSNASKMAYLFLIEFLKDREFVLLDSQFINNHTQSLGAIEIPKKAYLNMLKKAIKSEVV